MLWYPLQKKIKTLNTTAQLTPQDAFFSAMSEIMSEQQQSIGIPKRFQGVMKDILILQDKLSRREGKRAYKAFEHPKFRAGYDFLLLRAEIEAENSPELTVLAKWWTDFQNTSPETREQMIKSVVHSRTGQKRSPRKKRKPKAKVMPNTTESE
jgi:poly(A) polymerase